MAEKEKIKVTIISRDIITLYPTPGQPVEHVIISYLAPNMPPQTIEMRKEEWSKEEEAKRIREDIEKFKARKPEEIEV